MSGFVAAFVAASPCFFFFSLSKSCSIQSKRSAILSGEAVFFGFEDESTAARRCESGFAFDTAAVDTGTARDVVLGNAR
jgi:hypothetical protein